MPDRVTWLFAFVALYTVYCLYWGIASARRAGKPDDFFLASRETPAWVFVLTATALSVTGWITLGHPAMIFRDGFQFAQLALAAVVIPLAGILFLKRQWMLAARFGYVTPGELLADYFSGEALRVLVALIALVFAIPFAGMQLLASGHLIEGLTGGTVDRHAAMWVLSFTIFLYACFGGLRAVSFVGALQALLMVAGMVAVGCIAYIALGGFGAFNAALARLGSAPEAAANLLTIPGVIQFTDGLGREAPLGGPWTAMMILSYGFALAGLQASPGFSMLGFSCRDTRGFAAQQVWATGAVIGVVLLVFAVAQGMGAHVLGAPLPGGDMGGTVDLTVRTLNSVATRHPWLMALLAVCALAAIQVAAALYASTASAILARDIYRRYMRPGAGMHEQVLCARIVLALIFLLALVSATFVPQAQARLGTLAIGFGLQLWPALAGACWFPWITRQGATLGLCAGLIAVVLTEPIGGAMAQALGFALPWGRWPWTVHSAGWGIACNVVVCAVVSLATRGGEERRHRTAFHDVLRRHDGLPAGKRILRPAVWALTLAWLFFALGPGAVIGNDIFGAPDGGIEAWHLGVPSLWAWQVIWWALGVLVIWWLAYKMELSTAPRQAVEPDSDTLAESGPALAAPRWIGNLLRRLT